ncbi:ankyrin repeat-containing domain protein [Tuber brumale]|nr:ankyrin repeat-containing domain protein [Tuber brumale]
MSLLFLPNEILLEISHFQSLADQNSLLRTNYRLAYLFQHVLIDTLFSTQDKIHGRRALYAFASRNDITNVQALLDRGILSFIGSPVRIINKAIKSQTVATLRTLLDCGITTDIPDGRGWRPLIVAILTKKIEMVRLLVSKEEYGVNINTPLPQQGTPLMVATKAGFTEIVKVLLENPNLEVNATEPGGWSVLQIAINRKIISIVKLLLADSRTDISTLNGTILTPLMCAVKGKCVEIIQLLIQHSRFELYPTLSGNTPLHEAAKMKDTTILKMLLQDERMDINAMNERQFTPLHIASYCSEEAVRVLLDDGRADINACSQYDSTPLHIAALCGTEATVQMLLEDSRTNIHLLDIRRETALYIMMYRRVGGIGRAFLVDQEGES